MAQKIELEIPPILGLDNDYSFIEEIYGNTWGNLNPPVYDEKVSIIIPVYNRKEILGKTLAGILHQSYPLNLIEVIIADDGSSDHPEELVAKFEPFFSIKYVSQEDLGFRASAVRNLGVSESSNENLIFLDCDMLPLPNLIESMMKWLYVSKKVILIGHRRFVSTDAFSIDQCIETIEPLIDLPDINSE
ncbi:MAG: glycosyltransferase, partial [Euryarchaeota archaeon]|nr:glycosyltransferase [Euryarchaeota archaeon]